MTCPHGTIITGDARTALRGLGTGSVHCCITSPPYWGLRDYGVDGQIGLEPTPQEYIQSLLPVFNEVWRVLRDDGTLWLNLGDSYIGYHGNKNARDAAAPSDKGGYRENMRTTSVGAGGLKNKDLVGIPWRLAIALQDEGWYLRQDIIWAKPNPMPESVSDRCTRAHEYIFMFSKACKYYFDQNSILEPAVQRGSTRNKRSVWTVATKPFRGAHFATFPPDLVRPCVLAGAPEGGVVLDPFFGAGTVGVVCIEEGRRYLGIELNESYTGIAEERIKTTAAAYAVPKQGILMGATHDRPCR